MLLPTFTILFCCTLAASASLHWLHYAVPAYYVVLGCTTFLVYRSDKVAARANRLRTRESTLHLLGVAGGWPAALLAQRWLRHKSSKLAFQRTFRLTVILNCGVLALCFTPAGRNLVGSLMST